MSRHSVVTDRAPKPIANFSQAVVANGVVYMAGIASRDPQTGQVVGDTFKEQVELTMRNMVAILDAAGSSVENVVRVIVYLESRDDFPAFNEIWNRTFTSSEPPSRAVLMQPFFGLDGMRVELVVTAVVT
jgi:2-iminobutanoate/2-iminopropanoate deaminase